MQLSWQWNFTGRAGAWFFTSLAFMAAFICGLLAPWLISPRMTPDMMTVPAEVIRFDGADGMKHPVFRYASPEGTFLEFRSSIGSSRPAYLIGDRVQLALDPNDPSSIFVQDDRDSAVMIFIMRMIGGIFFVLSLVIFLMLISGVENQKISRIGGLLGALSFGVPASLALPGLWIAYAMRSNYLFRTQDAFDGQSLIIGIVFTSLGLLVTVATIKLCRYQARTGSDGWTWSNTATGKTAISDDAGSAPEEVSDELRSHRLH